jgi:glycosyltransferase involved in cell wall biosynthesis
MDKSVKISVVIPVYNSQENLVELVSGINRVLSVRGDSFEIVLVDDGSKDGSWNVLSELKKDAPDMITAVKLAKNFGQHKAILCGFNFSRGELVITMDDDQQHPPEEIAKLLATYAETQSDVVYGLPVDRQHGKLRSAGSLLTRRSSKYFGDNETGEGSSFRLITREVVDKIKLHNQTFMFIDEIIHWFTTDISMVDVEHHPRRRGKSQYNLVKLTRLYLNVLVNYSVWPLRLMTYGGLLLSLISFSLGIFFVIKKYAFDDIVPGFTATIVTILFSTSLILICFGIIGQFLYKMHQSQSGKPSYKIRKVL